MEHRNFIRLVGVLLLCCVVATAFHGSRLRIEGAINEAFKQAIEQDYQHRKSHLMRNRTVAYNVKDYALSPSFDREITNYTLRTRKGIITYHFKDSVDEETAKRLLAQHLLKKSYPLQPDQLKGYLKKLLQEKKVEGNVGILYICDNAYHWSDNDSIVPKKAYSTPRQTLDIAGQQKLQAWAHYGWGTTFRYLDPVAYVFLVLLIGVLMWIWPSRKRKKEDTEEGTDTAEADAKAEVPHSLHIDREKQELVIDGVDCTITKLDLALLQMLHERKGECLNRDDIKQQFWPTDNNANEKIDAHIKTIRKILKDFPHYQVVTIRGKGYYWKEGEQDRQPQ